MNMKTATTLVTYETVAQACEALAADGKRASVRNIIAHLGGGSPNVVLDFQRQWKAGRPVVKADAIQVDPRIGQIVAEQIGQAVALARADIEAQLAESEQDAETLGKAGREAETLAKSLEADLEAARGQVQNYAGQIDQLKGDAVQLRASSADQVRAAEERARAGIGKAEAEAEQERQGREAAQVALAKAELRLEALPRLVSDLEAVREELAQERKARVAAEQVAAVRDAETKAAERRATEAEAREQAAQARAIEVERQYQVATRDLATANLAVQAVQARLETASREVDEAKKQAQDARATAMKAVEAAAELRGRLAAGDPAKVDAVSEAAPKSSGKSKPTKPAA